MNPNYNPNYWSVYDQYKNFETDHEKLGYIDGLAMCCDMIDQSPNCYCTGNSVYDFGFDLAMKNMFEHPELARMLYIDLTNQLDKKWAEYCNRGE